MARIECPGKIFENVQAVIFDKDGTLANVESFLKSLGQKRSRLVDAQIPGVQEPLLMAFGLEGDQINPGGLLAVGSRRENEIAAAAYVAETGREWLESLEIARSAFQEADSYLKRKADHTPLFAGALDTLKSIRSADLKLGILSSDTTENVRDFVQKYQLEDYVQLYLGTDAGPSKPDPMLFKQACAALGTPPEVTLMIGDSKIDAALARVAGAAGYINVTWGWTEPAPFVHADVIIVRFDQIQVFS